MKFEATLMAVALIASEVSIFTTNCNYSSLFAFSLVNHIHTKRAFPFLFWEFSKLNQSQNSSEQNRIVSIFPFTNILKAYASAPISAVGTFMTNAKTYGASPIFWNSFI
jgi:hypothetical protein